MHLLEMTWPEVDQLSRNTPIVIPIAALEQHGHHMPVFTDSLLLGEVTARIHQQMADSILVAPVFWLGNSEHHLDFPGTMTAAPRTYLNLLKEMVENFLRHDFKRIVLLNGHGGNIVPSQQALFELRQERRTQDDLLLIAATYWNLGDGLPTGAEFSQNQMGHAGEWETSMMLRLRPELVKGHQQTQEVPFGQGFSPGYRAWVMPDRSSAGHIGDSPLATPEKGEVLFHHFSSGAVKFLQRVIDWDGSTWDQ
ncbi:MAG: creatininase family protein [Planctomycetaceae bacterium]|nr:creatininase family protein [Planctomycetaceae bacterium]